MQTETAYWPDSELILVSPVGLVNLDIETPEIRSYAEGDIDAIGKAVLDFLARSVFTKGKGTIEYRWIGQDTLNWGNPISWAQMHWIRCLLEGDVGFACLKNYGKLKEVIQDSHIQDLALSTAFRQPDKIRCFLKNHLGLLDLLPEALEHVRQIFGDETPVELEIISDPEGIGPETLFAYIVTPLPPDDALSLMDQLDSQWYLSQPLEILEIFNFNLCII